MDDDSADDSFEGLISELAKEEASINRHPFEQDLAGLAPELASDPDFTRGLYAALCNTFWLRKDKTYQESEGNKQILINEDGEEAYGISWRRAGGLASDIFHYGQVRSGRNYLEYYCSGNEGHVGDRVAKALDGLGWMSRSM